MPVPDSLRYTERRDFISLLNSDGYVLEFSSDGFVRNGYFEAPW